MSEQSVSLSVVNYVVQRKTVLHNVKCKNMNKYSNRIQMLRHRKFVAPISRFLNILSYFQKFSNIAKYEARF